VTGMQKIARIFPRLDGYDITLTIDGMDILTMHVEGVEIVKSDIEEYDLDDIVKDL